MMMQPLKRYKYKITILNSSKRRKKAITRQLHHFDGKFRSVTDIKAHLMEELGEEVPSSIHFDVGYYETRSTKSWLVTSEDLELMYSSLKSEEISLWCDADPHDDKKSDGKGKKRNGGTSSRFEEEDVDEHFTTLTEKHGDTYSVPQRRLWAQTIHCGTHDSYDTPPALPMFGPPPKRHKKESISDVMATVLAKAINPSASGSQEASSSIANQSSVAISPGKSVDLHMKNLQQLRFIQQLFDDNILSEEEFLEQKKSILEALRKLNN